MALALLFSVNVEFNAAMLLEVNTKRTVLRRLSVFDVNDLEIVRRSLAHLPLSPLKRYKNDYINDGER